MTAYDCDVLVVGGGIAGAIIALEAALEGRDVVVLEAGEATGLTWDGYQSNIEQFQASLMKVPNSPWTNSPQAPSPSVADIVNLGDGIGDDPAPSSSQGYFVQNGPMPFGSDYQRSLGGTTLHWYAHAIRMLPHDFHMRSHYGRGLDWPLEYHELEPDYEAAEREIGVAADVEDQLATGTPFREGYVFPMHKIPPTYLDSWLERHLAHSTVRIGGREYPSRVVPVPGGRNSTPNPAYDGGKGFHPQGAVGNPTQGLRCEGNASCIPGCPAQAKYSALKTLDKARRAGARIITQAVVTKVLARPRGGRVEGVEYQRWSAGEYGPQAPRTMHAKVVVLATHSIENAKLLLMSEFTNDNIGRHLMDHPFLLTWAMAPEPLGTFRGPGSSAGIETLRDGHFRREHSSFRVDIDNWGFGVIGSPGSDVDQLVFGSGLTGTELRRRLSDQVNRQLMLGFLLEQLPDPANRVQLSGLRDTLGNPRPALTYNIGDYTAQGAAVARDCATSWFREVRARELTDYSSIDWIAHQPLQWGGQTLRTLGAGHVCGTHIMGSDPERSVVDRDQREWYHDNLFVVGAGSMPTIGTSNPTLTLAALSYRTARSVIRESS